MAEKIKVVCGYLFQDEKEYINAIEDKRRIEQITEKIDWDDIDALLLVYNKLIEKNFFKTIVGLSFLNEMRSYILKEKKCKLKPIVIRKKINKVEIGKGTEYYLDKIQKLSEEKHNYSEKNKKMTIAIVALVTVIIGMFFIMATNENVGYFNAEEKVLNKYAAWEERLSNWEKELNERENILMGK